MWQITACVCSLSLSNTAWEIYKIVGVSTVGKNIKKIWWKTIVLPLKLNLFPSSTSTLNCKLASVTRRNSKCQFYFQRGVIFTFFLHHLIAIKMSIQCNREAQLPQTLKTSLGSENQSSFREIQTVRVALCWNTHPC